MKVANRNLWLLNILTFLYTFRTFEGVWVIYFASITGSYATAMGLFAVMHISSSSLEVPTGILSDRIGRKRTIILYCLFGFVSTLLFYVAESTMVLLAGSVLVGLSMALGSGTISAFVYENLEALNQSDLYKKYEGKRRAQGKYSIVVAGLLGSVIIYFYDIRTALLVTLVAIFASMIASVFLKDMRRVSINKSNIYSDIGIALKQFKTNASLRDFSLGRMFSRGVGNADYRFRSLFLSSIMPEWLVNLVNMAASLVVGLVMHANQFIVNKLGLKKSLIHLEVLNRSVVAVCVLLYTTTSGIVLTISNSISHGISDVASEDLLQARYTKDQRATMGSLVSLGSSVIYIITAVLSGFIADQIGLLYTMLLLQPFLLIPTYFFWRGLNR
jgi:MFS family permease